MKTCITRKQERALYEVIDNMQRAKWWEQDVQEVGLTMPWRFYRDLARCYLEEAFPNVDQYELYDNIEKKVDEEWTIRDIITWLEDFGLWQVEDEGLRFQLEILPDKIQDSRFYRELKHVKEEVVCRVKTFSK